MPRRRRGAPGSQASPPPGRALRRLNDSPPPRPPSRLVDPKGSTIRLPDALRSRRPRPANGCIRWLNGSPSFRRIALRGLSLLLRSTAACIRHHCASAHKPDMRHRACKIRIRPDSRRSSGSPNESSCPAPAVTGKGTHRSLQLAPVHGGNRLAVDCRASLLELRRQFRVPSILHTG